MGLNITPEIREMMKSWLREHPIDHAYDEEADKFDGNIPEEQLMSRDYQEILDANPE